MALTAKTHLILYIVMNYSPYVNHCANAIFLKEARAAQVFLSTALRDSFEDQGGLS
jgi:hypothetical protein